MDRQTGSTKTISVLIVDDQLPFRAVARTVIGMTTGSTSPPKPRSGEDAIAKVDAAPPDLVLMDINLPGINGIETTRQIRAAHPETSR